MRDIGESVSPNLYAYLRNSYGEIDFLGNYQLNMQTCTLPVKLKWYLIAIGWPDKKSVDDWFETARNQIEHTFNSKIYKCYPASKKCCLCREGVVVKVKVTRTYDKEDADYVVTLRYTETIRTSSVSRRNRTANLDSMDTNVRDRNRNINGMEHLFQQIPVVHEAGHMFGLSHPGGRSNETEAYMADPFSLMGLDMYLTERDFNTAFCRNIETADKNCVRWKANFNMDNAIA